MEQTLNAIHIITNPFIPTSYSLYLFVSTPGPIISSDRRPLQPEFRNRGNNLPQSQSGTVDSLDRFDRRDLMAIARGRQRRISSN